jgi:hypothetical protein
MIEMVRVIESWKISVRNEILADIGHSLNGLKRGTTLRSDSTSLTWKVVARIIFEQVENQKQFKIETERFLHFAFKPIENLEKFKQDIHRKESLGIHQYTIQPLGHDKKPEDGETLIVEELIPQKTKERAQGTTKRNK